MRALLLIVWFGIGLVIGALLTLACANAATTPTVTTFATPAMWPVVVCDGAAYSKNTKAQTFTITCPANSGVAPATLVVSGCPNPVLTAPAAGQLKLTC